MTKAALHRQAGAVAIVAALGLGAALVGGPAHAEDVCAEARGQAVAGQITKALSGDILAKNCADGKIQKVPGATLVGQRVQRIGAGGYVLPDYGGAGIRISATQVEIR